MTLRKVTSLLLFASFLFLSITGTLEYFLAHTQFIASLHTLFGFLFLIGACLHLYNNYRPLQLYLKDKLSYIIGGATVLLFITIFLDLSPIHAIMNFGNQLRANQKQEVNPATYQTIELNTENELKLNIDLLRGEHYWHPQMAIWTEDLEGNFIESLYITKATARGLFYGGRSKENFKSFDESNASQEEYRRVDALPVWSHKRGFQYSDGMFVPPPDQPLPDAITGATLPENFLLNTSMKKQSVFKLFIEINVAFDDNEYYSEYSFPDDSIFHAGTGQLGQPSIVFETQIDLHDSSQYYLMQLIGHGHPSGQDGIIRKDLSTLTTAKEIVKRIVVGWEENNAAPMSMK